MAEENPFDQFDEKSEENPFDQFDEAPQEQKQTLLSSKLDEQLSEANEVGGAESFLIGMGKGFSDIGKGVGLIEDTRPTEAAAYEQLEEQRPYTSGGGEILGQALPFVPAALAAEAAVPALAVKGGLGTIGTQAARVGAQGAIGAVEGGLIAEGQGNDVIQGAGIGGVVAGGIEAISPFIGRAVGSVFRKLTGKAPKGALITPKGKPTKELVDVLDSYGLTLDDFTNEAASSLKKTVPESAEDVARKTFLESQGIKPTQAQITRDAAQFQAQQEAAKTSSKVRIALEEQEAFLSSRFDNAIIDAQGGASNPSSIIDAVVDKATVLDDKISSLYRAARELAPEEKSIKFTSLRDQLRAKAGSNEATDGAIRAIVGDLQEKGILDKSLKVKGRVDVKTAEEIRKLMNKLYDPQKPFRNSVLRELKDSLDDDVFRSAGQDVFNQARSAKAGFEKELSRAGVSKFDSRKTNIVRDVLENKINPDRLVDDVVKSKKYRSADLKQLKSYISKESPEALDALRADTLESIKNKAFIGAEDAAGNKALSRAALERELAKIGDDKLKVLFDTKEIKFLNDMVKVSKLREPVRGTALGRGPSGQAVEKLEKTIKDIPILGHVVDFIDFDANGRAVLKSKAPLVKQLPSEIERQVGAGISSAAVPLAITSQDK